MQEVPEIPVPTFAGGQLWQAKTTTSDFSHLQHGILLHNWMFCSLLVCQLVSFHLEIHGQLISSIKLKKNSLIRNLLLWDEFKISRLIELALFLNMSHIEKHLKLLTEETVFS